MILSNVTCAVHLLTATRNDEFSLLYVLMRLNRPICKVPMCRRIPTEYRVLSLRSGFRSPILPVGSMCGLPAATGCSYLAAPAFDVWWSGILCRWSETDYRTLLAISQVRLTVSERDLKTFLSSVCSGLGDLSYNYHYTSIKRGNGKQHINQTMFLCCINVSNFVDNDGDGGQRVINYRKSY